jgi:hypothetical protein
MRFFYIFLLILIPGFLLQLFLPWWSIVIWAGLAGLAFRFDQAFTAFIAGFLAVGISWWGYAYYLDLSNGSLLSVRMGEILGGLSPLLLTLVTGLFGGLFGGLGALTGALARQMVQPSRSTDPA